jgi:hypothetical protein
MLGYDDLCEALVYCGFRVRRWKGERLYLGGYGRDISAYLEPDCGGGPSPADGYRLVVTSSWRAARYNGLRCKGVKHAIWGDLYRAALVSAPPPVDWQGVTLDEASAVRPLIRPYAAKPAAIAGEAGMVFGVAGRESRCEISKTAHWPARRERDPYAPLRALHRSDAQH